MGVYHVVLSSMYLWHQGGGHGGGACAEAFRTALATPCARCATPTHACDTRTCAHTQTHATLVRHVVQFCATQAATHAHLHTQRAHSNSHTAPHPYPSTHAAASQLVRNAARSHPRRRRWRARTRTLTLSHSPVRTTPTHAHHTGAHTHARTRTHTHGCSWCATWCRTTRRRR
jgi:hypothetical protein